MFAAGAQDTVVVSPKDQELLESLIKLPAGELGTLQREQFQRQLNTLKQGGELGAFRREDTQREVEGQLKPVPILQDRLVPQLSQNVNFAFYTRLEAAQEQTLVERARSVARVETVVSPTASVSRGTAFVVGDGLMATNCHVWSTIADVDAQGNWTVRAGARVHFADRPAHDLQKEFAITGLAGFSTVAGLDVAVFRVASVSVEGGHPLPPALPLRRTPLTTGPLGPGGALPSRVPIAIVGYPNVALSQEMNYSLLRERGSFAKVYSPGMVLETETVTNVSLLYHVASTTGGSSGSPIFSTDGFEVVGVHSCCTAAGESRPETFSCSQALRLPINRNVAISSNTVTDDRQLAPFFVRPPN